ncbi:GNAT family N-acetyltransferase [Halorarum halophilum]|uniref:GNAT family N-acetyltransferase n=1 Tax=Halorarum halophilum TaxID=2743090 RepID=A0A7D5GGA7_9EURY|nr:N-acetyltransferase [Halobaculum halophilum]QLG26651.1 GNAT family N-acetyltransferase [Halobaculum halophilum]
MSVNVEKRVDGPGDATHVEDAWTLKERIRAEEGVLKQRRGFFTDAYRRSTTYLFFEEGSLDSDGDTLVAFASVRRDGYVLFLAVEPDTRGRGYAERLVAQVAEEHGSVTCHARTTNEDALGFYEHVGFDIVRRIDNYYEDGGAAYYLRLGDDGGLTERLSEFLR